VCARGDLRCLETLWPTRCFRSPRGRRPTLVRRCQIIFRGAVSTGMVRCSPGAVPYPRSPEQILGGPWRSRSPSTTEVSFQLVEGQRAPSGVTLEVGEYPIATLRVKSIELCTEERFIVHNRLRTPRHHGSDGSGWVWAAPRQRRPMSTPSSIRSTVRSLRTRSIESLGCAARKAGPPSRGPMFLSRIAPALSGISQELPGRHGGDPAHHARDVAWQLESERRLPDQPHDQARGGHGQEGHQQSLPQQHADTCSCYRTALHSIKPAVAARLDSRSCATGGGRSAAAQASRSIQDMHQPLVLTSMPPKMSHGPHSSPSAPWYSRQFAQMWPS
jgi:hypothetical protein